MAVFLDKLESKTTVFGLVFGLFGIVAFLFFATQKLLTYISIMLLALGIPFNLDLNLFSRKYVGVSSVDIGVTFLSSVVLFALLVYKYLSESKKIPLLRAEGLLVAPVFLYIGAGFLSLHNAVSYELTTLELIRMFMLLFILYMVMNFRTRQQVSLFIFSLSLGVILQAIIALIQYKTGHSLGLQALGERGIEASGVEVIGRTGGTIGHPNMLAYFFEMLIPVMFAMLLTETRRAANIWYGAVVVCGMIGIVMTQSRGGWLGLAIAIPIVFLSIYPPRLNYLRSYPALFAGLAVALAVFIYVAPTIETRLQKGDQGSAATRAPLNKAAISIIKQYPVTGVGLNNLAKVFRAYDTTGGSAKFKGYSHVAHNLYLIVWAETGTIGFISFVMIFIAAFFVILKNCFKKTYQNKGLLVGIGAGFVAQLIHGLVDPGFKLQMNTSMLFYSMLGVIGAVSLLNKEKERDGK